MGQFAGAQTAVCADPLPPPPTDSYHPPAYYGCPPDTHSPIPHEKESTLNLLTSHARRSVTCLTSRRMTTRTRLRRTDGPGSGGTHDHTRGAPSEPLKGPSNATEALETPPPVPKLLEPGPRRAAPHTGIEGQEASGGCSGTVAVAAAAGVCHVPSKAPMSAPSLARGPADRRRDRPARPSPRGCLRRYSHPRSNHHHLR